MAIKKMRPQLNEWDYQKYLQGKSWKCSKSKTKAHYWIVDDDMFKCKYCGEQKKVTTVPVVYGRFGIRRNENAN